MSESQLRCCGHMAEDLWVWGCGQDGRLVLKTRGCGAVGTMGGSY